MDDDRQRGDAQRRHCRRRVRSQPRQAQGGCMCMGETLSTFRLISARLKLKKADFSLFLKLDYQKYFEMLKYLIL